MQEKSTNIGLREFALALVVVSITATVWVAVESRTNMGCEALWHFRPDPNELTDGLLWRFLGLTTTSFLLYWLMWSRVKKVRILLWTIVGSLLAFGHINGTIANVSEQNNRYRVGICAKSSAAGLTSELNRLTLEEYNYLRATEFLPLAPSGTKHLSVHFFYDDFFGEYSLQVTAAMPIAMADRFPPDSTWAGGAVEGDEMLFEFEKSNY